MSKKYIIGVIGTQNTGKSTFVNDLIEESKKRLTKPFITGDCDYRKKIEECGLLINRNGNLESLKIIFLCLVDLLIEAVNSDDIYNFISDRSVLDAYCYTKYLKEHNPELNITDYDLDCMYEKLRRYIKMYDEIIYIDLDDCDNVKVVDDKFRDTNLEYRKEIDQIFKETIGRLVLDEVVFDNRMTGSREERVRKFFELKKDKIAP